MDGFVKTVGGIPVSPNFSFPALIPISILSGWDRKYAKFGKGFGVLE